MNTVGVRIFVLRKGVEHSHVLLLRDADDRWHPVRGAVEADENEAQAAVRRLAGATGLEPERLYAMPGLVRNRDPAAGAVGRIGMFVAFVAHDRDVRPGPEHAEHRWLRLEDAAELLAPGAARGELADVRARFLRQAPDESLRVV